MSYHSHSMPQFSNPISLLFGCLQVRHLCTPTFRVSLFQHCHCNHHTCMPHHAIPSLFCVCYYFPLGLFFASDTSYHTSHQVRIASLYCCQTCAKRFCQAATFGLIADVLGQAFGTASCDGGTKPQGKKTQMAKKNSRNSRMAKRARRARLSN